MNAVNAALAGLIVSIATLAVAVVALQKSPLRIPVAVACALCVIAAIAVFFGGGRIELSSSNSVAISAVSAGPRNVSVDAQLQGQPAQGRVYWFVLEVHDVNGHSEWYPRHKIEGSGDFPVDIPGFADLSRKRTGAAYEVTAQDGEYFQSNLPDSNGSSEPLLDEPCCAVSNEIDLPY